MQTRTWITIGVVILVILALGVIGAMWTSTSMTPTVYP